MFEVSVIFTPGNTDFKRHTHKKKPQKQHTTKQQNNTCLRDFFKNFNV